jgi:protein associated with RNAse G/E
MYMCHNNHMLLYDGMMIGMYEEAMNYATEMEQRLLKVAANFPEWWNTAMGPFLDGFVPMVWMVYVRFGKWKEILGKDLS